MSESVFQRPQEEPYTPTPEDLARAEAEVARMRADADAMGPLPKATVDPALVRHKVRYEGVDFTVKTGRVYDLRVQQRMGTDPAGAIEMMIGADQYDQLLDTFKVVDEDGDIMYPGLMGGENSPLMRFFKAVVEVVDPTARPGGSSNS